MAKKGKKKKGGAKKKGHRKNKKRSAAAKRAYKKSGLYKHNKKRSKAAKKKARGKSAKKRGGKKKGKKKGGKKKSKGRGPLAWKAAAQRGAMIKGVMEKRGYTHAQAAVLVDRMLRRKHAPTKSKSGWAAARKAEAAADRVAANMRAAYSAGPSYA